MGELQSDAQDRIRATYLSTEYRHAESGWGIYILKAGDERVVSACGCLKHEPYTGESVTASGSWSRFENRGKVFEFTELKAVAPRNPDFFVPYLAAIGDIPQATASLIVETFGKDTLLVLSRSPERLSKIQGLSDTHRDRLLANWRNNRQHDLLEDELRNSGLNPELLLELSHKLPPEMTVSDVLSRDPWLIYVYTQTPFYQVKEFVSNTGNIAIGHFLEAGIIATARRALMQGRRSVPIQRALKEAPALLGIKTPVSEGDFHEAISWLGAEALIAKREDDELVLSEFQEDRSCVLSKLADLQDTDNEITDQLTGSQLAKILDRVSVTKPLARNAGTLAQFLRLKAVFIQAAHPAIARVFDAAIDALSETLHLEVLKLHAAYLVADETGEHSLAYLGSSDNGSSERGPHNPFEADIVIVHEAHLLTIEELKRVIQAVDNESNILFVGNAFSQSLHVLGMPIADLTETLPVLSLDELLNDWQDPTIRQVQALTAGQWMPPNDDDLDFNMPLIPIDCSDEDLPSVVQEICFGDLCEALGVDPKTGTQLIGFKPQTREQLDLLRRIEAGYAENLRALWEGSTVYRGFLKSSMARLDLPHYLAGTLETAESGQATFHIGSRTIALRPGESKHIGRAYLSHFSAAQQMRFPMIVIVLPSSATITNEQVLCAMNCCTGWTFIVGTTSNVVSHNLEQHYGL